MFNFFSEYLNNKQHDYNGWSTIYSLNGKLFRYALINRNTHIDIAIQTPKSPRGANEDNDYHLTHKLPLSKDSNIDKICIKSGKEPQTIEMAINILQEYVSLYSVWLETGKTIDQQIKELRN